ncbi:TIGR04255 family protein [Pseudomonas sp. CHM02]|uniref:TIGR04255 family protein n=1 Tax=Pseudomonas sp. CHM02 TaxID=1463662 RepID=UPI000471E149|nr:TIGR04255 family protein [Pseudomonas sp. CHM02]
MKAKIVPYNEKLGHAIRNVLFVFEFAQHVVPQAMLAFKPGTDLHNSLKSLLPKYGEQQQFVVNFSNDNSFVHQGFPQPSLATGVTFEKIKEDGEPALGLNIQGNMLSIVCGDYTRWEEVISKVNSVIEVIASWLREFAVFASLTLQYLDEFKVSFETGEFAPLTDLFVSGSPYLVPNFENVNRDFHSHHGFFSDPEFAIAGRLLTNVNVNVVNIGKDINVQIQTTHKYLAAAHLTIGEEGLKGLIGDAYEYLHQENKKIVGSMLTSEVKKAISFDARRKEG